MLELKQENMQIELKRISVGYDLWSKQDWLEFSKSLFDVDEFLRTIQMAFARWHNQMANRQGKHLFVFLKFAKN
jgi:hypothetical protein